MALTEAENRLLTQTDAGTPLGEMMRRYWLPAMTSDRLGEPGGDPRPLRLLGENLVVFRDSNGEAHILDELCPHRLASLTLARNENCALQCVYHGWRIAGDGTILETPPEPPNSKFAQSFKHKAYPTREAGGVVWVYMGPAEDEPAFPDYTFNTLPAANVFPVVMLQPCNYLQGLEGDIEAAHAGYLHYSDEEAARQEAAHRQMKFLKDPRPRHAVEAAPWGLHSMQRLDIGEDGKTLCWVKPIVMPCFTLAGITLDDGSEAYVAHAWVPIDDENHYFWTWFWSAQGELDATFRAATIEAGNYYVDPETLIHREFVDGAYIQHRDWMREKGHFSGFNGISVQDLGVQISMGRIVDRTREHLASEDMTVVQYRRYLLKVLGDFQRGAGPLPGLQKDMSYADLDFRGLIINSDVDPAEIFRRREWRGSVDA